MHHHWSRKILISLSAAALIVGVSACSGSGSSGSSNSSGSGADITAAKALVAQYSAPMTSVNLPPLSKKPASGKKIVMVLNNTTGNASVAAGVEAAAQVLGWTTTKLIYDPSTPTGLTDAFSQAIALAPDGVVTSALNQTDYAAAAATLKSEGIPVVTSTATDEVSPPVIANVFNAASTATSGQVAAAYVIATLGDTASVAMFNVPSFPVLKVYEDAFLVEYQKLCPTCHYETHPVQASDIGTNAPSQVVSAIQANPAINVAAMGFGQLSTGVPAALASAGITNVKIVGISPSLDNISALLNGTETMWVGFPLEGLGWKSVDALARQFNADPVDVATTAATPMQILTHDNVTSPPQQPEIVDVAGVFEKLWLVN